MANRVLRAGQVERVLANIYTSYFVAISNDALFPWDMIGLKRKYNEEVYSKTRTAITKIYNEGTSYVGYKLNADVYPTETDVANIKSETDKIMISFWNRIEEDSKRTREQEVQQEKKLKDRETQKMLAGVATVAMTSALALGTMSKTKQIAPTEEAQPIIRWVAMLDEKTCKILPNGNPGCAYLDGREWPYDSVEIPTPGRLGPDGTHPHCRCYLDLIIQ